MFEQFRNAEAVIIGHLKFEWRLVYYCDWRSPIFISTPQLTLLKVLAHCAPKENFWRE